MSQTERLRAATKEALRSFEGVQFALADQQLSAKPGTKMLLAQQVESLRALLHDLSTGAPSRKAWSYGQAALPVLEIIVKSVRNKSSEPDHELMNRCGASLVEFGDALMAVAEGRNGANNSGF